MRLGADGVSVEASREVYAAHHCGFWGGK